MNTAVLDRKAFWDNVWDDNKEAIYNRYHRQRSVTHWQVGLCCVGTKYYAKDEDGGDIKSREINKKKSHAFLQRCNGSHLSSQWYPPSCPLSVQPISSKRRAYQMGFSLNSLEAEQLKHALQRDGSVSGITLNQNQAFNCSCRSEYSKSETALNFYLIDFFNFPELFFSFFLHW